MSRRDNQTAVGRLYAALERGDHSVGAALFSDDIQFNVIRSLPMLTRKGREAATAYVAETLGWTPLDGAMKLEQLAATEDTVFSIHVEAEGTEREHRHCMVWRMKEGKVVEINELTLGDPPSLKHVDIAKLEALGHKVVILGAGSYGA